MHKAAAAPALHSPAPFGPAFPLAVLRFPGHAGVLRVSLPRLELLPQDAHDQGVAVAAVLEPMLAQPPLFYEAALPVADDGPLVVLEHFEIDTVQVHLGEGEPEEGGDGVCAVALRPVSFLP